MQLDCQLRAFNAEVTASPRITLSTMILWLAHWARNFFWDARGDCLWRRGVFPYVILVCRGQGRSRQYIVAVWIPFARLWVFLPSQHGHWA